MSLDNFAGWKRQGPSDKATRQRQAAGKAWLSPRFHGALHPNIPVMELMGESYFCSDVRRCHWCSPCSSLLDALSQGPRVEPDGSNFSICRI